MDFALIQLFYTKKHTRNNFPYFFSFLYFFSKVCNGNTSVELYITSKTPVQITCIRCYTSTNEKLSASPGAATTHRATGSLHIHNIKWHSSFLRASLVRCWIVQTTHSKLINSDIFSFLSTCAACKCCFGNEALSGSGQAD